jgi:rhamnosyltransferase
VPAQLAVVTVTFNPDLEVLRTQLAAMPPGCLHVIVDNASGTDAIARLRELVAGNSDVLFLENAVNAGLASALNAGAGAARSARPDCTMLLLLDQDSEPEPGGVEALLAAFDELEAVHPRVGSIGPALLDPDTGLLHGFHRIAGWRWQRVPPVGRTPIDVANLNGSGTLVPFEVFTRLGGLSSDLFIDHVDTVWAFRVAAAGYSLFGIPWVRFRHRMGVRGMRVWLFGWRLWPYRSPARHFYLFRNTVRLLRAGGVPAVWKAWAPVKLLVTMIVHLLFDRERWAQQRAKLRGIRAGFGSWARAAG